MKHQPRAVQKTKRKKKFVILSSQVQEEKSCFVFVAYAYVARVNQAIPLNLPTDFVYITLYE